MIAAIIKGATTRDGNNLTILSRLTGIPYQTLVYRLKHPETLRFGEWGTIQRNVSFLPDELEIIRKEVMKL